MTCIHFNSLTKLIAGLAFVATVSLARADWKVVEHFPNPLGPGKAVDVLHDGNRSPGLFPGEGQIKPFLHIFGSGGELVTNPGLDRKGNGAGLFNHHRGSLSAGIGFHLNWANTTCGTRVARATGVTIS
ncbi:MAG: hypothetical protein CM1200mP29_12190 [Verrucomicrobiota bacterium]|nr:MAG: hypothetical protein CM1200mP29_12190 [Verrucomicrobiota bacterium]